MNPTIRNVHGPLGFALLLGIGGHAAGQETVRASIDSSGKEASLYSYFPSISASGGMVVFCSLADDLVSGDTNAKADIFLRDLAAGVTELVSVDSTGVQANNSTYSSTVSGDGRYVAFASYADNLVYKDTNRAWDIFLRDRALRTTTILSLAPLGVEADSSSYDPKIADDAFAVAFTSAATNLVPGDKNRALDVFVRDLQTGLLERISVSSAGSEADDDSYLGAISRDGRYVAFASYAANLVSGDTNGVSDIFVRDRKLRTTLRVNLAEDGSEANDESYDPVISDDGGVVGYLSVATNLVRSDTNGGMDAFVFDRTRRTVERVNVDSAGVQSDHHASSLALSSTGRYAAFEDIGENLVRGDTNQAADIFVRDREAQVTWRASVATDGTEGDDDSEEVSIDDSGLAIAFSSAASNLVADDTNYYMDVMVRTELPASWRNYGAGHPGTLGVPGLAALSDPVIGARFDVSIGNSAGIDTLALLFMGYNEADLPTSAGGSLLLESILTIPLSVPAAGLTMGAVLPDDPLFAGFQFDLQTIELDDGASDGLSFSAGLEIQLGR